MNNLLVDVLGWVGSIMLILAYLLNSKNVINAQSSAYQLLNVVGSILLVINTIFYGAYPSSAVNIIWVFIGGHYLVKNYKHEKAIH